MRRREGLWGTSCTSMSNKADNYGHQRYLAAVEVLLIADLQ